MNIIGIIAVVIFIFLYCKYGQVNKRSNSIVDRKQKGMFTGLWVLLIYAGVVILVMGVPLLWVAYAMA